MLKGRTEDESRADAIRRRWIGLTLLALSTLVVVLLVVLPFNDYAPPQTAEEMAAATADGNMVLLDAYKDHLELRAGALYAALAVGIVGVVLVALASRAASRSHRDDRRR